MSTPACHRWLGAVLLMVLVTGVDAEEPGSLAWFEKQWQKASDWTIPAPRQFTFESIVEHTVDPRKLGDLVTQGATHPTHPSHSLWLRLDRWHRFPKHPGTASLFVLKEGWRIDKEHLAEHLEESDRWKVVADGTKRWSMSPGYMLVTDKSEPAEHFSFDNERAAWESQLREHALFSMGNLRDAPWQFSPVRSEVMAGGLWEGDVATASGDMIKRFEGRIDGRGNVMISSVTVVVAEGEKAPLLGHKMIFEDRFPGSLLGVPWGAAKISILHENIGLREVRILREVIAVDPNTLPDGLLEPPINGNDALRGEVEVSMLRDVQQGREGRFAKDNDDQFVLIDDNAGDWWKTSASATISKPILLAAVALMLGSIIGVFFWRRTHS